MTFNSQQSLRQDLLIRALGLVKDPEVALRIAAKFESFVMEGSPASVQEESALHSALNIAQMRNREGPSAAPTVMRPRWSAEEETRLRKLWTDGLAVKEIAAHLGRTPASVNGRVRHLALPNRKKRANPANKSSVNDSPSSSAELPPTIGRSALPIPNSGGS